MRHKPAKNSNSPILDIEILVLHAIEQHQQIFISGNERIELLIQILEHRASDSVITVCSSCYKELMK